MTPLHPMEVELKLALPPQQVEAFLKLMARRRAPEKQALLTRYFDTPDFALSAQGVALRVRRVGRRWLQTLKTEGERIGGLSRRVEYEMPIRKGEPDWAAFPPEARVWVPEALRAQLKPMFETRFERTAWQIRGTRGAPMEVALDIGKVVAGSRSQPICEIELELKAGQPTALFDLALTWARRLDCLPFDISKAERGVRLAHDRPLTPVKSLPLTLQGKMAVAEGFAAAVQACLTQFQANVPGVLASDDIEYVHQARVALRRLRAVLHAYRKGFELPDALMQGLRALVASMGPARDWDVLCHEVLPEAAPNFADRDLWQRGMAQLQAHRAEVRACMRRELLSARPGEWLLKMQLELLQRSEQGVPAAPPARSTTSLAQSAAAILQKGHRRISKGVEAFADLSPTQRHALRIEIKRQRYMAELFSGVFMGRRQDRYLASLKKLQDVLGREHDSLIAHDLLLDFPIESATMRQFVDDWLAARQRQAAPGSSSKPLQNFIKSSPYW